MQEEWRIIDGFEGKYSISNLGNCKNNNSDKILKPHLGDRGYYRFGLYDRENNKTITKRVNRLVAITFLDNPNNHPNVNHKDGNKKNNQVDNLEWCTQKHNVNHALENGLKKTKLTRKEVREIENEQFKIDRDDLAVNYGITVQRVSSIWYEKNKRDGKTKEEVKENRRLYGKKLRGEEHYNSKLNNQKVAEIKRLLEENKTGAEVARMFGVSTDTISKIKRGHRWN